MRRFLPVLTVFLSLSPLAKAQWEAPELDNSTPPYLRVTPSYESDGFGNRFIVGYYLHMKYTHFPLEGEESYAPNTGTGYALWYDSFAQAHYTLSCDLSATINPDYSVTWEGSLFIPTGGSCNGDEVDLWMEVNLIHFPTGSTLNQSYTGPSGPIREF